MELKWTLFLTFFLLVLQLDTSSGNPPASCGDPSWVPFQEEKCFKLIKDYVTREKAESLCNSFQVGSGLPAASLVSIKSAAEQGFLANLLYKDGTDVDANVWIGAQRSTAKNGGFVWATDGSPLEYSNWAQNSPSESAGRDCVVLQSGLSRTNPELGKWRDVSCRIVNYAVCQKAIAQSGPASLAQIQQQLISARKELRDSLSEAQRKLAETDSELLQANQDLAAAKQEMHGVTQCSFPLGYIYTQLYGQSTPGTMWPATSWTEVSSTYAGLFFRVVGDGAAQFGAIQAAQAPRLLEAKYMTYDLNVPFLREVTLPVTDEWSSWLLAGIYEGTNYINGVAFNISAGEVRPRNQAIRLWKRTG